MLVYYRDKWKNEYKNVYSFNSSSEGSAVHDKPWPLSRLHAIGPDHGTFVSNF
jgi:hypothetical protein